MEEQSNEALWYVVHTYSGYENKVANDLQTMVENRHLQDLICDIKVPVEMVPEIDKNGKQKMVEHKLFPGYVLVKMVMNDDTWYVVRNTRGCTGFVGPASKPVPLSAEEVEKMGVEIDKVVNLIVPGEAITKRMSGRRVCAKCGASYHIINKPSAKEGVCDRCGGELAIRKDDEPATVLDRLKASLNEEQWEAYRRAHPDLMKIYREQGEEGNTVVVGYRFK